MGTFFKNVGPFSLIVVMDFELSFLFRNQTYSCTAFIDASEEPYYVFIQLKDSLLIREFGDEVTIKTDFEKRLPKKDDLGAIVDLRQCLFNALKDHPQFRGAHRKIQLGNALEVPNESTTTKQWRNNKAPL